MAIHVLTSVTGSPGVTTTALAWATLAAAPTLLVEADMTGGSAVLAGPFRGEIAPERTVLSLAEYQPHEMAEQLWWHTLTLPGTTDRQVLPTIASPAQARALAPVWHAVGDAITQAADATGTDVLIDYGRLSTQHAPRPLLDIADTIIVLLPGTMAGINTTKRTLDVLRDELLATGSPRRLVAAPVLPAGVIRRWWRAGTAARPWAAGELAKLLAPHDMLHPIVYDPDAASVYSAGTLAGRGMHAYQASITELAAAANAHTHQLRVLAGQDTQ